MTSKNSRWSSARPGCPRRLFLSAATAAAVTGLAGGGQGLKQLLAAEADQLKRRGKSMILLWMNGGPSQFETFDPKPNSENGGPTKAIATSVPGIRIADNFPKFAEIMDDVALVRSMTGKEGSHPRATYQMHTGYIPAGSVKHPSLGSCVVKEIGDLAEELPSFVSIGNTQGAGFLGMDYEPFMVRTPGQLPANVGAPVTRERFKSRLSLMNDLNTAYQDLGSKQQVASHRSLYRKSSKLVLSPQASVFNFDDERAQTKAAYGDSAFGKGCLLARRLIEAGTTFVEVRSKTWDSHRDNFESCANNAMEVDPAMTSLIKDLKDRGRLDDTLIVWMGEFGRTPRINAGGGRDHYPAVFNIALAGGGIQGGQVYGSSNASGTAVNENPVTVLDLFQTICASLGIDPNRENMSPLGRPMKIVDGGTPIPGLLG